MAKKLHEIIIVEETPNIDPCEATEYIRYIVWTDVQDTKILKDIRGIVFVDNEGFFLHHKGRLLVECDPRYDQEELKIEIFNALATYIPGGQNG